MPDVARWLGQLYRLCSAGKRGPAVDLVVYTFDDLLFLQDRERSDEILATIDVEQLMVEVLLAVLMETFRAQFSTGRSAKDSSNGWRRGSAGSDPRR